METSRIPISAIIFDAGDILVHKIPDEKTTVWNEFLTRFTSERDCKESFGQLYEKVRVLGSNSEYVSLNSTLEIKLSLIEEYEIEKWWKNRENNKFEYTYNDECLKIVHYSKDTTYFRIYLPDNISTEVKENAEITYKDKTSIILKSLNEKNIVMQFNKY